MQEKVFIMSRRMIVTMECVGVADEDGSVTIVDVRRIELPSACDVMDGLTSDECEQMDADFAAAD